MFKFKMPALLFGLIVLCSMLSCKKTAEITSSDADNSVIIPVNLNEVPSNFKVEANLLKDSNTLSLYLEYLVSPGPNITVGINRIPNQTGTYKIIKNIYPPFEAHAGLLVASGDEIYDIYTVLETANNSITISNLDAADKTVSGDFKCTFVRVNPDPKYHTFSDTIVIEKNGFVLPYKVN